MKFTLVANFQTSKNLIFLCYIFMLKQRRTKSYWCEQTLGAKQFHTNNIIIHVHVDFTFTCMYNVYAQNITDRHTGIVERQTEHT